MQTASIKATVSEARAMETWSNAACLAPRSSNTLRGPGRPFGSRLFGSLPNPDESAGLTLPEACIVAAPGQQFFMSSGFRNASLVQNDNPVHLRNR